jgi:hypothetical protein
MVKAMAMRVVVGMLAFLLAVSVVEMAKAGERRGEADWGRWHTVTFDPYGSRGGDQILRAV